VAAVWLRLRAELRARWRAWVALGIALGIAAGASIAAASGAVRADAAYPRYTRAQEAAHVTLGGIGADDPAVIETIRGQIAAFPEVVASSFGQFVTDSAVLRRTGEVAAFPNVLVIGSADPRGGIDFDRPKILEGRLYDLSASDEAVVDWSAADKLDLRIGDVIDIRLYDMESESDRPALVPAPVRVVGIAVFPGAVPAVGQAPLSGIAVTPAFMRMHARFIPPSNDAPSVLLRDDRDIPSFLERLQGLPVEVDVVSTLPEHIAGVQRTLRCEVLALWLLSGLVALAAVAIFGQALARLTFTESAGFESLAALGMSRGSLTAIGIIRATGVGAVAALVAAGVAVAGSVLTPIGISRVLEPDPGVAVNPAVLAVGLAATLLAAPALSSWPAFRTARTRDAGGVPRPSAIARNVARWAPVAPATGIRMALDPGRGRRALPTRTAVLGTMIGVAAVAAALVFAASLGHLIRTPELYGFNWSLVASNERAPAELAEALQNDPDVEALSRGGAINMVIGGKPLVPFVYEQGAIGPTILSGRAPSGAGEIVLGPTLMRNLGIEIGDEVSVEIPDEEHPTPPAALRVVGTTVVPAILFQQVLPGEGAALTVDAVRQLAPETIRPGEEIPWIVRYRPGVDVDAKHGALFDRVPGLFTLQLRQPGGDLISLIRVEKIPIALAGLLAFMAAATLIHALLSSIRGRRHDVAILKTLGLRARQVRRVVRWQAATLSAIAVVVALPAGMAGGRWAWSAFATSLGVVDVPRVPPLAIGALPPVTLALAALIAAVPGRAASRTRPALVLRTE